MSASAYIYWLAVDGDRRSEPPIAVGQVDLAHWQLRTLRHCSVTVR